MSNAWKPRSISGGASSPVDEIKSVLGKISGKNYDALLGKVLTTTILESEIDKAAPESPVDDSRDMELMNPIVDAFMRNIKCENETSSNVDIYANLFIDIKKGWTGRHGSTMVKLFNNHLGSFIKEYLEKTEKSPKDNLEMNTVAKFIGLLYMKNEVPGLYIMKVMEGFYGTSIENLNVVARILKTVISKLKTEPYFKAKLEKKYRTLMENEMNSHGGAFKFLVEDILKTW
jgi:hypothetical protein